MSKIPNVEIWALPRGGEAVCLTDLGDYELSRADGDVGSVSLSYPQGGEGWELLHELRKPYRRLEVEIRTGGTAAGAERAILTDAKGDSTKPGSIWTVTGLYLGMIMGHARCPYSDDGPNGDTVIEGTPGTIVRTLMVRAQARGVLLDVDFSSFTNSLDSNGQPWTYTATLTFSPGRDYLSILQEMQTKLGIADWDLTAGRELQLFNPGSRGRDLTIPVPGGVPVDEDGLPVVTTGLTVGPDTLVGPDTIVGPGVPPPDALRDAGQVVLEYGRDFFDGPVTSSNRDVGTTVTGVGVNGMYVQAENETALAQLGEKIEIYADFGSVYDDATLQALTQDAAAQKAGGAHSYSHDLALTPNSPTPGVDYRVADWILRAINGTTERVKVSQLVLRRSAGKVSVSVTLGDLLADQAVKTQQQLDSMQNGSSIIGTSTQTPATDDGKAPAAPTGLTASTLAYYDGGTPMAQLSASWSPVLTNADGTALDDLSGYEVWYRYGTGQDLPTAYQIAGITANTSLSWGQIPQGTNVHVAVRAVDKWAHAGALSAEVLITTATDADAPPVPSAPIVGSQIGILTAQSDGLGASGEPMSGDFREFEVHLSNLGPLFEPDRPENLALSETLAGKLSGQGTFPISVSDFYGVPADTLYGVTFYVKLVAVDKTGNASAASEAGSVVLTAAGDGDIAAVGIGKLTAGIMSALMTVSGIIQTAATGARVVIDSTGLRCYSSTGAVLFEFNIPGSFLAMLGRFTAGTSTNAGDRIVLDPDYNGPGGNGLPTLLFHTNGGTVGPGRANAFSTGGTLTGVGFNSGPSVSGATYEQSSLQLRPDRVGLGMVNQAGGATGDATMSLYKSGLIEILGKLAKLDLEANGDVWLRREAGDGKVNQLFISADGTYATAKNTAGANVAQMALHSNGSAAFLSEGGGIRIAADGTTDSDRPMGTTAAGFSLKAQGGSSAGYRSYMNGSVLTFVENGSNAFVNLGNGAGAYKTFVIPHPVEGFEDRWLVHVATESPDARVQYEGQAVIVDGHATVEAPDLPHYFEALCRDEGRTVQVTMLLPDEPMTETMPGALAPEPVIPFARQPDGPPTIRPEHTMIYPVAASLPRNGRFRVVSPAPDGTRVAWTVSAIRRGPDVVVEPLRSDVDPHGDGPYRYLTPRQGAA